MWLMMFISDVMHHEISKCDSSALDMPFLMSKHFLFQSLELTLDLLNDKF